MKTVFILADSTNRRFLNLYGARHGAFTPNLDRLAADGMVFDNHWCGSAPCMPARRDILTGRLNFLEKPWGGLEPFDQTLPALLKTKNVYSRMVTDHYLYLHVGGENYWNDFTSNEILRGQEFDSLNMPAGREGVVKQERPAGYRGIYSQEHDETYGRFQSEDEYPSPMTMTKAADWLERNHDADNFFLWVEGFDPHEPFDVPQKYIDLYRDDDGGDCDGGDQPCYWPEYGKDLYTDADRRHLNVRYKALLTMTDHYIGKILDVLDRHGMWDDTLVIFTTDHGYMLGEHGYMAKNYMPAYNEVFHIPLIVRHPRGKAGRFSGPTQNIDLFPTILNWFGVDQRALHYPIHGKDLLPALTGETDRVRDGVIYGYFGKSVNYTDGRYAYLRAAKDVSNRPLNVYAATPTTLRQYYGEGCIAPEDYGKIAFDHLRWTDYPVYRFPADIIDFKNPSQEYAKRSEHNARTCLYDLESDYAQEHPLNDPALEAEYAAKLRAAMEAHDSPAEQFERLGL